MRRFCVVPPAACFILLLCVCEQIWQHDLTVCGIDLESLVSRENVCSYMICSTYCNCNCNCENRYSSMTLGLRYPPPWDQEHSTTPTRRHIYYAVSTDDPPQLELCVCAVPQSLDSFALRTANGVGYRFNWLAGRCTTSLSLSMDVTILCCLKL